MPNPLIKGISPFTIAVSDEQLHDLSRRLKDTRWSDYIGNKDWFYGVNAAYLRGLVGYWIDGFDWRVAERALNGFANYRESRCSLVQLGLSQGS
jgi:hypothetical protein